MNVRSLTELIYKAYEKAIQPLSHAVVWAVNVSGGVFENNLIQTLQHDSNLAVEWFKKNKMTDNPDKFQTMLL